MSRYSLTLGKHFDRMLEQLKVSQCRSLEVLERLQWQNLMSIIYHAYENVPYYQRMLKKGDVDPGEMQSFEDLSMIPICSKESILTARDDFISRDTSGWKFKLMTSGSTGKPFGIFSTRKAFGWTIANQIRGRRWWHINENDRGVMMLGTSSGLFPRRAMIALKDRVFHNRRIFMNYAQRLNAKEIVQAMQDYRPAFLYAYPSVLYQLALDIIRDGLDIRRNQLKAIICTGEVLYTHQRELIESAFRCRIANEYGCGEGGLIAFECPEGGLHISMESVYVEILRNNEPVSPGETGEIVVTNLKNYAMPFIRYRTGDLGSLSNETCKCGRKLQLLKSIEGRVLDLVTTTEGKVSACGLFDHIYKELAKDKIASLGEFRIIQKTIHHFVIETPRMGFLDDRDARSYVAERQKAFTNIQVRLTFDTVGSIPRSRSGKVRYFVSEMEKDSKADHIKMVTSQTRCLH